MCQQVDLVSSKIPKVDRWYMLAIGMLSSAAAAGCLIGLPDGVLDFDVQAATMQLNAAVADVLSGIVPELVSSSLP